MKRRSRNLALVAVLVPVVMFGAYYAYVRFLWSPDLSPLFQVVEELEERILTIPPDEIARAVQESRLSREAPSALEAPSVAPDEESR